MEGFLEFLGPRGVGFRDEGGSFWGLWTWGLRIT